MNINILSSDIDLLSEAKKYDDFSDVRIIQELEEHVHGDILIVSDTKIPYEDLNSIPSGNYKYIFYTIQPTYKPGFEKTIKIICDSKDIDLIPSHLTIDQTIKRILSVIDPKIQHESNVISLFSSLSNIGTTTTCLSLGQALSQYSNKKVGVLLLNAWDDGTDTLRYEGSYLNEIKNHLSGELYEDEVDFLSLFYKEEENLYVLAGNKDTKVERLFTVKEISYLIRRAKESFDVVLIDAGSHFDNANMVQALEESSLKLLILNQQPKSIKKFKQIYKDILYPLGYKFTDFLLLINQFQDKVYLMQAKEIVNQVEVPQLTVVPYSAYSHQSEMEQKILYTYDDEIYQKTINSVAKAIAREIGFELFINEKKKSFLSSLINKG